MTADQTLALAESIVAQGFTSLDDEIATLLADARNAHVSHVIVDVVGDPMAPTAVRERALGRIVVELSRDAVMPPLPAWVTSRFTQHAAV